MKVTVYTTHCPKCKVIETKLKAKNIDYIEVADINVMESKGFTSVPILEVNGEIMDYNAAVKWIMDGGKNNEE